MKIYIIPNPYDYHGQGAILVKAKNRREARIKVEKKFKNSSIVVAEMKEWKTTFYENHGCDC